MSELRNFRAVLAFVVAAGFLVYHTYVELRYAVVGRPARGIVAQVEPYVRTLSHGRQDPRLKVRYRFAADDGAPQTGEDDQEADASAPAVGEWVDVEFCPGRPATSRLAVNGHPVTVAVILLFVGAGLIGVTVLQLALKSDPANRASLPNDRFAVLDPITR